jgi:UDP:flavonoid glycosyltransferase YjiC (YdhE family)
MVCAEKRKKKKPIAFLFFCCRETATRYVVTDTRRHKFNFCIGAFTVFLMVTFIALLQTAIARSPIIFLKLAEVMRAACERLRWRLCVLNICFDRMKSVNLICLWYRRRKARMMLARCFASFVCCFFPV